MGEARYDAIVIGAGVCGCSIARELSRLEGRFLVLEAGEDVCCGTSKANSAIVHAGFDAPTGSLMARLNVEGSRLFPALAKELGFGYEAIGSLVVCTGNDDLPALRALHERGVANGVPDLRIVMRDELLSLEPNISDAAVAALWAPTGAICDPFGLTAALAENAAQNGVSFRFDAPVTGLVRQAATEGETPLWKVETPVGAFFSRVVINAAGVYADAIHNLASAQKMQIIPRRGEYLLLDTTAYGHVRHTIFALPTRMGKGVLVTPTVHGNVLVGPTATDISDKEGTQTTQAGIESVVSSSALTVRDIPFGETITSFSGLRAHLPSHEFVIGEVADAPGLIDCAGIESPGLSASPAIGRMVAGIANGLLGLPSNAGFSGTRTPCPSFDKSTEDEWNALVGQDRAFGTVVCRCRRVFEAEIRDACRRVPGARSLDGVKRRTCAGMGRCQGGFCTPRVMEILSEEVDGLDLSHVTKSGPGSRLTSSLWIPAAEGEGGNA